MNTKRKDLPIYSWWVTNTDSKMEFADITIGKVVPNQFYIVGYRRDKYSILAPKVIRSSDSIIKVKKNGVIAKSGTFYPFDEAHLLYLKFLIDIREENIIVATNWKFSKKDFSMTANISTRDLEIKVYDVTFDFIPDESIDILYKGYSEKLQSTIILSPFDKKDVETDVVTSKMIAADIYNTSFLEGKDVLLQDVQNAIKK